MIYHMMAFALGFIIDLLVGDPHFLPHPVVLIGKLISLTEKKLRKKTDSFDDEIRKGRLLVITVLLSTFIASVCILTAAYLISVYAGLVIETVMTYQILAVKSLKTESMKVYKCIENGDIEGGRKAVSMIVGRDTENLSEEQIVKAAVETVAENTSDAVIAPLVYLAIGGPVLGFLYKAVNTMDSMVGYKNERYLYFGRAAAKLDDIVNYVPARISAVLMIAAACISGPDYSGKDALRIFRRDRMKHASPNSAQTESVCAGALGLQLAGDASYFGKTVHKPFIGDKLREAEYEDIRRANRLMYASSCICEIICLAVLAVICFVR